jgi:hypothetical protein
MVDLIRAIQVDREGGGIDRVLAFLGGRQVSSHAFSLNPLRRKLADWRCLDGSQVPRSGGKSQRSEDDTGSAVRVHHKADQLRIHESATGLVRFYRESTLFPSLIQVCLRYAGSRG